MKAVGISDIGKCRKNNEDAYYISAGDDPAENLYLVADGMGGLANGRMVSSALVRSILNGFANADPRQNSEDLLLEQAVIANSGVNHMLQGQSRSGSTLVCRSPMALPPIRTSS